MTGMGNINPATNFQKYPYIQNNFNGAANIPGNFNGDATPLDNSIPAQIASTASSDGQNNPLGLITSFGLGAAICMGIERFIDTLSKRTNGQDSHFDNIIQKLDNNKAVQTIDSVVNPVFNKINGFKTQHKDSEVYKKLKEGYSRVSFLSPASTEIQLIEKLGDELKKDSIYKNITDPKLKEIIDSLNSLKDKKLSKTDYAQIAGKLDSLSPEIKLLNNKIGLLQKVGKNSFISKILVKSGIGSGHFLGGGMVGILLNGFFVGQSIKAAWDAPKGEKFSTLMEDVLGNWIGAWVLMFPIGKLVNAVAGLRKLENPQGIQKILKGIGKIVGLGLDNQQVKNFDAVMGAKNLLGKGGKLDMFGKWLGGPKGFAGGALRAILVMFALTPIASEALKKVSHFFFGKPSHPEENKPEEKKPENTSENKTQPGTKNLVDDYFQRNSIKTGENTTQNTVQSQPVQQQAQIFKQPEQPQTRYIPQPVSTISQGANSQINDTITNSEKIEKHALEVANQFR